jgi:pSer/pThr/pTyr-binding forkhead associated (FHA) protein
VAAIVSAATTASTSAVEATPDATLAPTTVSTEVTSSSAETTPATLTPVLRSLLWAIPLLLVALGYGIYRSWRTSSGQASRPRRSAPADPYALSETTNADEKLLPSNRPKPAAGNARTKDNLQTHAAEPVSEPLPRPLPPADDEATFVPTYGLGDDEATYRLTEEIEQPIIGYFVRVTSNPALPAELPIYGLNPGPGEVRQIHIGRHSKNNTVVINDNSISREHAAIVQRDGRLYLRDNASTAGTFLNWRRLRPGEELLLRHNDLVSFGEIVYEFRAKGEDEATVAAE